MDRRIDIVGAGPAGLVAAINLAGAGYSVTVYEQNPDVGHRFHGDFQGIENWSSEEDAALVMQRLGVKENFICRPCCFVQVFDADLKRTLVESGRPVFYLVRRGPMEGSLDRGLLERAIESGVRVLFNRRVDRLEGGGIVSVGPRAADAIAKGVVFRTDMEDSAAVIFDDRLAPEGYAYLLVHSGRGTLATCMFGEFKRERECFERTVYTFSRLFPSLDIRDEKEFGGYGNFFFGRPLYENGRFYVGEAAGLQDCLWGFGLRYAMVSGYLAARSLIDGAERAPLLYVMSLKREIVDMHRASLANRFLYARLGNRGYAYFIRTLAGGDVIGALRKVYAPSLLKKILFPVASWSFRSRLVDKGCHEEGCTCVWCRCRRKERYDGSN